MAERRVKYILEVDYEGESVAVKAADDLREIDTAARQADDGLRQAGGGFSDIQAKIVTMQSALGVAEQAFAAIQQAAEFAYETLNRGAELTLQKEQFDALAGSIGTTTDALQNDLSAATEGLQSNAEMVAGASQLMSLGLAKSHDEVVALSEVSGQLGWDIQVLGLTIANQSTARLDALELSIESVTSKIPALREQGLSADEAFKWAIIEAGREKIEIVGSTADTTAGKMKILENIVKDVQDEFARGAAEGFAEALEDISGSAQDASAGMSQLGYVGGLFVGEVIPELLDQMPRVFDAIGAGWIPQLAQLAAAFGIVTTEVETQTLAQREYEEMATAYAKSQANAQEEIVFAYQTSAEAIDEAMAAQAGVVEQYDVLSAAAVMAAEDGYYLAESFAAQGQAAEDLAARQQLATDAAQRWADVTAQLTSTGGDYFTQFMESGDNVWNVADALYAAADGAGAGAGPLADIAVQLGIINQESAGLFVEQAQQQTIIDQLAGAAAQGKIPWDEFYTSVQKAFDLLAGGPPETPQAIRVPVEMEWDQTYGGDPMALGADFKPIQVPVSANYDQVEAAVNSARGIVEGFTDPAEVYKAVMNMDISDVEADILAASGIVEAFVNPAELYEAVMHMDIAEVVTKGTDVTNIINGLPDQKTVTINVQAIGMGILDELRAAGVIP